VVKNKVAPPFKEAEFDIMYGAGISREGDIVDLGADSGIIEKSGAWYSYNNERIGQGRENARRFLIENPKIAAALEERLRKDIGLLVAAPSRGASASEEEEDDGNGTKSAGRNPREVKVNGGRRGAEARN
jgi:recombination protein RecA